VVAEPVQLRTERLLLRPWRDCDLVPFAALNADAEVMRYFPSTLDRAASDAAVQRFRAHFDEHGWGWWAVEIPGVTSFAGFVGLSSVVDVAPIAPAVEVGWRLARAHWGRGYASEGARAAVDFGFHVAGLAEIVSMTSVSNAPSRRVMQKLGMTHDPADDFDHPRVPPGDPQRRQVLYRLQKPVGHP
jgi:RimJ/RimL family protein N-acetyltransferase